MKKLDHFAEQKADHQQEEKRGMAVMHNSLAAMHHLKRSTCTMAAASMRIRTGRGARFRRKRCKMEAELTPHCSTTAAKVLSPPERLLNLSGQGAQSHAEYTPDSSETPTP